MSIPTAHKSGENYLIFVVFCVVEFTINIATNIATSTSPRNHHKSDKSTIEIHHIFTTSSPQLHHNSTTTPPQLYSKNHHNFMWISPQLDHHNLWCFLWCFCLGEIHHMYFSQWWSIPVDGKSCKNWRLLCLDTLVTSTGGKILHENCELE